MKKKRNIKLAYIIILQVNVLGQTYSTTISKIILGKKPKFIRGGLCYKPGGFATSHTSLWYDIPPPPPISSYAFKLAPPHFEYCLVLLATLTRGRMGGLWAQGHGNAVQS